MRIIYDNITPVRESENIIIFLKNEVFVFKYNEKYNYIWCNYILIWDVLYKSFSLNTNERIKLIKNVIWKDYLNKDNELLVRIFPWFST